MPQYSKTTWVDGSAPAISAANLNKLEQGVFDAIRQDGSTTMSAQLVTIAGTAATPAIAPTGDSNTGIFFPAADTIAFGEGGTEAMRINSSGNVGIGTNSPTNKLQIDGVTANTSAINAVANTTTGQSFGIALSAGTNSSDYAMNIRNAAQTTQLFHITGAGNVGIGTTSPDVGSTGNKVLTVTGTFTRGRIQLQNTDGGVSAVAGTVQFLNQSYDIGSITATADSASGATGFLTFTTNSTERMRITSAGNVGIGTSSPNQSGYSGRALSLSGTADSVVEVISTSNNTNGKTLGAVQFVNAGSGITGVAACSIFAQQSGTSATAPGSMIGFATRADGGAAMAERMRINADGNVGIGTTSPSAKLDVSGTKIQLSGSSVNSTIGISDSSCNYNFNMFTQSADIAQLSVINKTVASGSKDLWITAASHNFNTWNGSAYSTRALIDTNGYLLIGYTTSNGAYPLQVNGQIFATSSTIATSDGRYKKDIVSLDGALDIVAALNPVQFSWKDHPVHKFNTDVPTVGFIAQEVAEVLKDKAYLTSVIKKSECTWETETGEFVDKEVTKEVEREVTVDVVDAETGETTQQTQTITETVTETIQEPVKEVHTEEFYGIAESNMIAILTKAIQELNAKVTALEAQLAK